MISEELRDLVRRFAEKEIAPSVMEDDEHGIFRLPLVKKMGEQGLLGVITPEEYGGSGLGYQEYVVVLEEMARISPAYAVTIAVTGLPQMILSRFGTDEQKRRFLPGLASGDLLGAFSLSEPMAGSDAASLRTTARRDGDRFVIEGRKVFVTSGGVADTYVVFARTGGPGAKGISAFMVTKDAPNFFVGRMEDKLGIRASPTAELIFESCRIPEENLLGSEGEGFRIAMTALDSGRITIAAIAVGLARAAFEKALAYAKERQQFGRPIIEFQGIGFMLADMATKIDASSLLVEKAARLRDEGKKHTMEAAQAKTFATDTAVDATIAAVQIHGGYGYTREYEVERMMRDARVLQIVEGTNEIQRLVMARLLADGERE